MNESLASSDPGTQKRRSTRIVQAVPITVTGVDALGQPFKERTTTVMVNCHGCKYQSKHYVPKNTVVTLEVPRPETSLPPRMVLGRVVWVQRPRTVRELFQIGLEFEIAGNVWGIAFPPEDWFPVSGEEVSAPTAPEPEAAAPVPPPTPRNAAVHPPAREIEIEATKVEPPVRSPAAPAMPPTDSKLHVVPSASPMPAPSQDSQLAMARQMAKMVAEAKETIDKTARRGAQTAINEEMTVVRVQLDAQLHDAVEKAIKISMERVSESAVKKVVQQAADRTAAIVEEARKASGADAAQLDAKVRQAVQEAVSGAAEQAAQQAAAQTAGHNLKQAVEDAVERAITEREAATPSLEILSSPEAAQKHLDQWRKNLEETAQAVRNQTVEQSQADATAANQRWQQEFEAALANASQTLGGTLTDVSQAALSQAEQDIAARALSLRATLDEAVAEARSTVESLGSGLEQERARAEETEAHLQQAAKIAIEQTQQRLDDMLSEQHREIARKAEQVIADRAQQLEPILENSARKVIEHFSGELDQKLAPKLEQVQKVVAELAGAEQETVRVRAEIREQVQRASEQVTDLRNTVRDQVRDASGQVTKLEDAIREQMRHAAEQAAQLGSTVRERVREVSEEAVQASLEQLNRETAKYPAQFEESCRAALSKVEEELGQKSTEAQHETYEALQKAAEWYQKKAQTTMQSSLEKAVEHSTAALRDRAAEISSLVASELDHYRRSYLEHSHAQIEEAANEVVERERGRLSESAQIAAASFTDRVQHVATESLGRFEETSRETLEKARSDMEYNRDGSLAEFQTALDNKMLEGVQQARTHLQSQLGPLVEAWEEKRELEKKEWAKQLKKSTDESIEQYKTRLENASNSWLLASATTLGQHSQAVLDTLAKAAEKRMRETCAEVLSGMGDTLKQRLLGISTDLGADDDEDDVPRKKI